MPVTINLIVSEAFRFSAERGLHVNLNFDGMRQAVRRCMDRYKLTYRTKTHTETHLDEWEMAETILDFVSGFRRLSTSLDIPPCCIYNMDRTAVYYDNGPSKTIEQRGVKSISIRTSSNASFRATVFLCVSFDGQKLPPLIVFKATRNKAVHKQLKSSTKAGCNPMCAYSVQENAWCDQNSMNDWIELFGQNIDFRTMNILLLDNFSVHCTQDTHDALSQHNTMVELLPPNFTSKLQPLDVGINKPF